MFEINYMSGNKRVLKDIESEQGKLGTQSRIYDCVTGIFTRILTNDHKTFSFTESGIGFNGILQEAYFFTDVLDCDEDEKFMLPYDIIEKIDDLSDLSIEDINFILQNGILQFLSQRDSEFSSKPGVGTLLRAEQILMQFEKEGKIGYDEVLQGIIASLGKDDLSDEDRTILEQLKNVYENDMFKAQREGDEVIQEEQNRANIALSQATDKKHIPTEITEGRQNGGKTIQRATTSDKTQVLEEKWTVSSVNGQKNGQEGEWKSLDQIQGEQTLLTNNLFGISFRIIPIGDGKYKISEFRVSPLNIYDRLMKETGMDTKRAYAEIKKELESGEWTEINIRGLMDYGVVEGISTRLQLRDKDNHFATNTRGEFLNNNDIETMRQLEWDEYFYYKPGKTDEEKLDLLERFMDNEPKSSTMLMYKKYKEIVEEKQKSRTYGARAILEYMEKHNLTTQDLSLALAMQATNTGVRGAEGNIVDIKTRQNTPDRGEATQIG